MFFIIFVLSILLVLTILYSLIRDRLLKALINLLTSLPYNKWITYTEIKKMGYDDVLIRYGLKIFCEAKHIDVRLQDEITVPKYSLGLAGLLQHYDIPNGIELNELFIRYAYKHEDFMHIFEFRRKSRSPQRKEKKKLFDFRPRLIPVTL